MQEGVFIGEEDNSSVVRYLYTFNIDIWSYYAFS